MRSILYYKEGFGRRIMKASLAQVAGLKHIVDGLFTSLEPPSPATAPTILGAGGDTTVGVVITATPGTYNGDPTPTLSYQWQADGADIPGETGLTFDTTGRSIGEVITVIETATNSNGFVSATSAGITLT